MDKFDWEKIGTVPVDSGEIMICDPCSGEDAGRTRRKEIDDNGNFRIGEIPLLVKAGYDVGVISTTGFGDGCYNVYVQRGHGGFEEGRVMRLLVEFNEEFDEDEDED